MSYLALLVNAFRHTLHFLSFSALYHWLPYRLRYPSPSLISKLSVSESASYSIAIGYFVSGVVICTITANLLPSASFSASSRLTV